MSNRNKQKPDLKSEPSKEKSMKIPFLLSILLLTILTYFVYSSATDNQFVNWDDQVYVEEQPLVLKKEYAQLWKTPVSLNYHPVTMISFAMQVPKDLKKLTAKPFIRMNVWLHIFNSALVFLLLWMLNDKKWLVALFTAAIFALHPMHVESVVWVSERKDVLYTFFFLLSLIAYWQYLSNNKKYWLLLTFFCFLLSVLSKAMAVVLPIVLLLLDYWKGKDFKDMKVWIEKIPFLGVSMFFGLMAVSVQNGGDFGGLLTLVGEKSNAIADTEIFNYWQRFQFASYGFVSYIIKFFVPTDICAFYPYPDGNKLNSIQGILYPLTFVTILFLAFWSAFRTKIFAFGIGFYFVTVALVLQFMSVGLAIMADRYTYVPYIGLAFLLLYAIDKWINVKGPSIKYLTLGVLSLFVTFLSYKTKSQVEVWQNSETLWTQVLQYYPKEDLALANRGNYRGKTGNIDGAMSDFEIAIADGCQRSDVYEGLGNSYGTLSEQQSDKKNEYTLKAIEMYKKALSIEPSKGNIYYNLGIAQLQTNPAASEVAFNESLKLMPYKESDILPLLGMSQLNAGKYISAVETLTKSINLGNNSDLVYYHRGLANLGAGNIENARSDFKYALALNPKNENARSRLNNL